MKIFHRRFCTELILQTSFCALETPREIVAAVLHRVPGGCRAQQLLLPPRCDQELGTRGLGAGTSPAPGQCETPRAGCRICFR